MFVLPYLEVGPSRRYGDRRVGLTGAMLFVAMMAILSYMGTPRYAVISSDDQEIVAELLPQTHPGPVRQADWDAYVTAPVTADNPTGRAIYLASEWQQAPTPELRELLHEMQEGLERSRVRAEQNLLGSLKNGQGYLIVEEWQTDLKRLTFRITSEGKDGSPAPTEICVVGAQNEYCQVAYVHRNANYRQGP